MAKGTQVQYIRLYTDGSAAKKIAENPPARKIVLPKQRLPKKIVLSIDPIGVLATATASVMMIVLVVGVCRLYGAKQEYRAMEQYVQTLKEENVRLSQEYAEGYDLEEIEKTALAIGMVPKAQLQSRTITLSAAQQTEAPISLWNRIGTFLTGIFA